ncbi:MAG: 3-hydroxyacyl-CoA dehydrogenase NAD-binding domain-containing protein [Christensenellales bacterium]|nr:3-hydroxyacyl-CoA dehydrogenase NAD-binding domain-containing protein [Christensenellales bacterium]
MSIITIVGAGMMGSAIGIPAAHNGHQVRMVGTPLDRDIIDHARRTGEHLTMKRRLPDSYRYYQFEEMAEAMENCALLVGGVSSFGIDWFCDHVLKTVDPALPILTVTKGMMDDEAGNLTVYPDLFEARSGHRGLKLNAVGGPCTSYELADLDYTQVTFCGKDPELLRWIRSLFETDYYNVSISTDVVGVEAAVAMKNAYALGVSLAVGMAEARDGVIGAQHFNSQAALFGQSAREMKKLLSWMGAHEDSLMLGIGDLYVTVFGGRTRKIGTLLGRGMGFDEAMESLKGVTLESILIATRSARAVRKKIADGVLDAADFPLLMHIYEIIVNKKPVDIPWKAFELQYVD